VKKKDYSRNYRKKAGNQGLVSFSIVCDESDLFIRAKKQLVARAYESTKKYRQDIISYIGKHPSFKTTFSPFVVDDSPPPVVFSMIRAAHAAGVGPMAAVAGAVAEHVGKDLLAFSDEVIVENGGDIFLKTETMRTIGTFAGESTFSDKVFFEISPEATPLGVCTSSGTVGHSFSYGAADAVTVISRSASLADAAATALCNVVKKDEDIEKALEMSKNIPGALGTVIIKGDDIGMIGDLRIKKRQSDDSIIFLVSTR